MPVFKLQKLNSVSILKFYLQQTWTTTGITSQRAWQMDNLPFLCILYSNVKRPVRAAAISRATVCLFFGCVNHLALCILYLVFVLRFTSSESYKYHTGILFRYRRRYHDTAIYKSHKPFWHGPSGTIESTKMALQKRTEVITSRSSFLHSHNISYLLVKVIYYIPSSISTFCLTNSWSTVVKYSNPIIKQQDYVS